MVNERDGVLILSENTGAYEELGAFALGVNPFDIEEQAEAISPRPRHAGRGAPRAPATHLRTSWSTTASTTGCARSSTTSTPSLAGALGRSRGRRGQGRSAVWPVGALAQQAPYSAS